MIIFCNSPQYTGNVITIYPKTIPLSSRERSFALGNVKLKQIIVLRNRQVIWLRYRKIIRRIWCRVFRSCCSYAICSRSIFSAINHLINNLQVSFHIRDHHFVNLIPSLSLCTFPTNELSVLHIKICIVCTILNGPTILFCFIVLICCTDYEFVSRSRCSFCSRSRIIDPNLWHIIAISCRLKAIQFCTC